MPYCKICGEFAFMWDVWKLDDDSTVVTSRCNNDHLDRFTETMDCKKCGHNGDGVHALLPVLSNIQDLWEKCVDRFNLIDEDDPHNVIRFLALLEFSHMIGKATVQLHFNNHPCWLHVERERAIFCRHCSVRIDHGGDEI